MFTRSRYRLGISLLLLFGLVLSLSLWYASSNSRPNNGMTLSVSQKQGAEAELLSKMYALLLRKNGFTVIEKPDIIPTDRIFQAIRDGTIDLYPEFTTDGLGVLKLPPSHDAQQDYQKVKQGYEQQYRVTWLDLAPLNDTYGICTLQSIASINNISDLSQLASIASHLTIAVPPDGSSDPNALPSAIKTYGFQFNSTIDFPDEAGTYQAVINNQAQVNLCYTTDPKISIDNFVLLKDDKGAFPAYNPAPILRDETLKKAPQIAKILNPLAPRLTSDVSMMLQRQVLAGLSVSDVATNWLKGQGLLS